MVTIYHVLNRSAFKIPVSCARASLGATTVSWTVLGKFSGNCAESGAQGTHRANIPSYFKACVLPLVLLTRYRTSSTMPSTIVSHSTQHS